MDTLRKSMRSTKSPKATAPPLSRDSATATSLTLERQGQPSPETDTSSASRCSTKTSRSQHRPRRPRERQRQGPTRPTRPRPFQRTEDRLDRAPKALCSLPQPQGTRYITGFSNIIVTRYVIQSGASYLSQGFVMLFHVICKGLPGQ